MIAASSVCDRAAATCSSEPIASAAIDRTPSTSSPTTPPSAESGPPIRTTTKSLNERNGPNVAGISDPGEVHGERSREPGDGARHAERRRPQTHDRHVQRDGGRLALARGGELQADRRARERDVDEDREQRQHERELVVLGR